MERELSLGDYLNIFNKNRMIIILFVFIALVFTAIGTLLAPKIYISKATIMPVSSAGGTIASLLSSTPFGSPVEQSARTILVVLSSRNLAAEVSGILDLPQRFGSGKSEKDKARVFEKLRKNVMRFNVTKDGSIIISAETTDPELSAKIVNTYIDKLTGFLNKNSISTTFTVIDRAIVPYTFDKPSIKINLIIASFVSLLLGCFYAVFREYKEKKL